MYQQGWDYPLHLGVTEAGEGEDGRIKSAIGIGSLLMDGLGDTIRVSLTEAPELEIDPCRRLAQLATEAIDKQYGVPQFKETTRDFKSYERRQVSSQLLRLDELTPFSLFHFPTLKKMKMNGWRCFEINWNWLHVSSKAGETSRAT